ncbi:hypothetical protein NQZ68_017807 [Dissostichus eleginoides]|nr:hypothetical protein NQZ68_017807 [Dissostichus eleginoides]
MKMLKSISRSISNLLNFDKESGLAVKVSRWAESWQDIKGGRTVSSFTSSSLLFKMGKKDPQTACLQQRCEKTVAGLSSEFQGHTRMKALSFKFA